MAESTDRPGEVPTTETAAPTRPAAEGTPQGPNGEHHRTPLLAVLGAGEAAVAAVAKAFADARARAAAGRETVTHRFSELPAEFEELRHRFSTEELRHALETYREQVNRAYAEFAARGEQTWGRLREQPKVRNALSAVEATGEKVARAGQKFTGRTADTVVGASAEASSAVATTGTATAGAIEDAGDTAAAATRSATRKAVGEPGASAADEGGD